MTFCRFGAPQRSPLLLLNQPPSFLRGYFNWELWARWGFSLRDICNNGEACISHDVTHDQACFWLTAYSKRYGECIRLYQSNHVFSIN